MRNAANNTATACAALLLVIALASCGSGKPSNSTARADSTAFADSVKACETTIGAVAEPSLDTAVSTQDQERCAAILSRNAIKQYYPRAR